MFLIFYLFRCLYDYTKSAGFDYMCIAIHPKHKLTYDSLMFKDLGGLKLYKKCKSCSAIAKYVNIKTLEKEYIISKKEGLHQIFFAITFAWINFPLRNYFTRNG